jgi:hypothetical protein
MYLSLQLRIIGKGKASGWQSIRLRYQSDMQGKAGLLVENGWSSLLYGILELFLNGLYSLVGLVCWRRYYVTLRITRRPNTDISLGSLRCIFLPHT